jgi:hypothetical protein
MRVEKSGAAAMLLAAAACGPVFAAGGHHAVDDAAILEPGQCEVEGWFAKVRRAERLVHAGAGCRVGPVELGIASEYARDAGASQTGWGLQAKWATELREGLSVGLSAGPAWAAHVRPRYQGVTVSALLTWNPAENWAVHANIGRDLVHRDRDANRSGVAAEWTPREGWSLLAERYAEERTQFLRAGVRWSFGKNWLVDVSHAHRLSGPGASAWTVGIGTTFDR